MPLIEEFEAAGSWLFRWRSYLPLLMLLLIPAGLAQFDYPLGSHILDELWEMFCLAVSALGLTVRVVTTGFSATGTSGRQTKEQVAATLNSTGMYSIVRNPLYLGNFLMALGVVMFIRAWWLPLLYAAIFTLYYERIVVAEERFLRHEFGQKFDEWATKTPAFIPRFRQWKSAPSAVQLAKGVTPRVSRCAGDRLKHVFFGGGRRSIRRLWVSNRRALERHSSGQHRFLHSHPVFA